MTSSPQVLVVLTGPVGAGKSSTAQAVARRLRALDIGAACLDLDVVYGMARQRDGFDEPAIWSVARRSAAALSEVFFATVADVVIVEGGFHDAQEIAELTGHLSTPLQLAVFTLHVSFDGVRARVEADPDPGRVASRNADFLRALHAQFVAALPYLQAHSTVLNSDVPDLDTVAATIAVEVVRRVRSD